MPRSDPFLGLKRAVEDAQDRLKAALGKGRGTQRATNAILRVAGYNAGMRFANVYLPKRFDPNYAHNVLGYQASTEYEKLKRYAVNAPNHRKVQNFLSRHHVMPPQPRPFVLTGDSMRRCLSSVSVTVRAIGSQGRMRISVSCDAAAIKLTPQYRNFTRITANERMQVLKEFQRQVDELTKQTGPGKVYTKSFTWSNERDIPALQERSVGA